MKKNYMVMIFSIILLQNVFAGGTKETEVKTVEYVDMEKFSGKWLVAALIPSPLEKNAQRGLETYTVKENGEIDIEYSYYKNNKPEKKKVMTQKGWIIDSSTNAHWKISPLWPLKFNYYIIELADDYSYTVIGTDSMNYLWIMVRRDAFDGFDLEGIINSMTEKGYDRNKIKIMNQ
ncbi:MULTISPECIES: lipocalin family protein [unclassified Oceanispirochaeta]|uniref:lipocalin family protein n=1 Tax=unclassified Oceanispirochaeta TaxID=2635722 RepID=UPI000E0998EB|nr:MULTISPECIES: lipocalin family protein [unclassified Oceanispirochaeta]MBF9014329.1 lipocalin family protein [Oceanispirochaeta sp. M2]NPD71215.1 lipocalin family protein [Oceanispirochaeta sp. M1]RDG33602.1 hypothetical protein DV872_03790 [Oceanispirochaeta sp. M1]